MDYETYNTKGGAVTGVGLQNKSTWYVHDETIGHSFVEAYGKRLNLQTNLENAADKFPLALKNPAPFPMQGWIYR